ncbi:hypothetical protein CH330_06165 [candidate division WOR-3 bacterium JGI_Cruoil_03_51_56]|uniref:DUF5667 domain-containing protein n=1 Tax=candidate division WOR-3 bacterium JGI_Cruoil_03_51_56 TaxID=1973747 RepID=A0A235BSI1_UNCW3|nr:MAG: hypothetical protein CH330_06165 [candidate division WOR-3 bacterium JGI_Cruoil_03_51_56]
MKRLFIPLIALFAIALAQNGENVHKELVLTDRIINRARPVIEQSSNGDAQKLFAQAEAVQTNAWDLFKQHRYMLALRKTGWARKLVERALKLAKFDPRRVEEEVRRTAEIMNEAGPVIIRSEIPKALELWRVAKGEQETSRRAFENKYFLLALKFTMAARVHTRTAFGIVRRKGNPDRVQKEVERTKELLDKAAEQTKLVSDDRVHELLHRANDWQDQAVVALRAGQLPRALKFTFSARDLLLRVWRMVRGPANPELVEQALAETDRLVEQWADAIRQQSSKEALDMLERALEHQTKAQEHFGQRKLQPALQETSLARRLLNRAVELVESEEVLPDKNPNEENPGKH